MSEETTKRMRTQTVSIESRQSEAELDLSTAELELHLRRMGAEIQRPLNPVHPLGDKDPVAVKDGKVIAFWV